MFTKVSKEDFKKSIIAYFEKETGLTITEAKAKIKKEIIVDKWGNTDRGIVYLLSFLRT